MCAYYYLTPITQHSAASIHHLTDTLSSLTVDELVVILPLLRRLLRDIMQYPHLASLPRLFLALWNRIANSLYEQQVTTLLLPPLNELLEQSQQAHNTLPLLALCQRPVLTQVFHHVGPKHFLKTLFPPMLEQLCG